MIVSLIDRTYICCWMGKWGIHLKIVWRLLSYYVYHILIHDLWLAPSSYYYYVYLGKMSEIDLSVTPFLQNRISVADIIGFGGSEFVSSKPDGMIMRF